MCKRERGIPKCWASTCRIASFAWPFSAGSCTYTTNTPSFRTKTRSSLDFGFAQTTTFVSTPYCAAGGGCGEVIGGGWTGELGVFFSAMMLVIRMPA